MRLGTAFQLIDDVLDYSGDEAAIGKSLGDDLAEGKPTLPLLYTMRAGDQEQAGPIRKTIQEGGREEFAAVLAAVRATGALAYARSVAQGEADAARSALTPLAPSEERQSLLELASFSVTRQA